MAHPTVVSGGARGSLSRAVVTNHASQFALVNGSPTYDSTNDETTIEVHSLDAIDQPSNYSDSDPGLLVVVDGTSDSDDGKTANITDISSTTITADGDLTSALGDEDVIGVIPPLSVELNTQGGHTVNVSNQKDEEMGLTSQVLTHNTLTGYNVEGDIPIFASIDSEGLGRLLLAATGAHKIGSNNDEHLYRLPLDNDGTFTENGELSLYSVEGDATAREVFFNQFVTQLDLEVPRRGVANVGVTTQGSEAVREIGGTGKDFPTGSGNWDTESFPVDRGKRHAARGALIEFGGSYGDALDKSNMDQHFQEVTISLSHDPTDYAPLGKAARAKASKITTTLEVTGTRVMEDNELQDRFYGSGNPTPGQQTEDRMLIKVVNPNDPTKYLKLDTPLGTYTVSDINRGDQFEESFTYRAHHTLQSDGQIDTSAPLFEFEYRNGDTADYATTV